MNPLKNWAHHKCLTFNFGSNPINYKNWQERKLLLGTLQKSSIFEGKKEILSL